MTEELPFCECGECGLRVTKLGNRFIKGHNRRGVKASVATRKKLSEAKLGHETSDGTKRKMSESHLGREASDAAKLKMSEAQSGEKNGFYGHEHSDKSKLKISGSVKIRFQDRDVREKMAITCENMKGGNDIVNHHYIYDHSDLSKYMMKVTRKKHGQIHAWMKKAGIIVPHINVKVV